MITFRVEMKDGQPSRIVEADSFSPGDAFGWIIFYRRPATGGTVEYWRVRLDSVISIETVRNAS